MWLQFRRRTNDTHISIIVEDVTHPGSRHLVDPGTRRPLCAAIPLDFDKESPVYKFHYMRSKFFRDGDFLTWCAQTPMNTGSKQVMYDSEGQKWHKQVNFWLTEKRHWHPFVDLENVLPGLQCAQGAPFNGLIFFAYLDDKIVSVLALGGKFITYFLEEDSYEKVEMTKSQLLELLQTNFPQYSESKLREVFENCPWVRNVGQYGVFCTSAILVQWYDSVKCNLNVKGGHVCSLHTLISLPREVLCC
ncbi:hypothetical protein BSL78_18801 [Apostichopus japonicus]|uniref:Uncharacterized protein n=1 Tax=Stichopus japonicus TaxID=307972 RepID=A0A2G8K8I4_STIJA|nr:hypothetical protein BSL78_18801 [Apostichopus japonicus]